ncbi:MAG: virginiamycin B lyase family protein [Thermomicrobiales bacterium]
MRLLGSFRSVRRGRDRGGLRLLPAFRLMAAPLPPPGMRMQHVRKARLPLGIALMLALTLPSLAVSATSSQPAVTAIAPGGGSVAGGTTLTITGTGFAPGATVRVGGYAAPAVSVSGTTQITARTPAHAAGSAAVVITNPDTLSGTSPTNYTYAVGSTGSTVTPVITEFPAQTDLGGPYYIAAGPDGNLWFTYNHDYYIGRITPAGAVVQYPIPNHQQANSIAAGPDGNLWFTQGGLIGRMTPTGVVTEFTLPADSASLFIAAGPDGNLWFTEDPSGPQYVAKVVRITPAGAITEFSDGLVGGSMPSSIAAGLDGNMWCIDTNYGGHYIGHITPAGVITEVSASLVMAGRSGSIAAGPDGNMWFTDPEGNGIGQITPAGGIAEFYDGISAGSHPIGLAAGTDGNRWFTEYGGNRIGRITTGGKVTEFPTPYAGSSPWSIAAGPDGNLWFTELLGPGIGRVTIAPPPPPVVSAAAPSSGPTTGGTRVTLTGSGFLAGAAVAFDGIAGTNVTVVSDTQITVTAPAHTAAGSVDIAVTNPGSGTGTLAHGYTYYVTPNALPGPQPPGATGGNASPLPPNRPPGPLSGTHPNPLPPPR